jgi:hypothetical protein
MRQHRHRRVRILVCAIAFLAIARSGPALAQVPASDLLPQIPPELLRELAKPDADMPPSAVPPATPPTPCRGNLPRVNGEVVCDTDKADTTCARLPRVNGQSACR